MPVTAHLELVDADAAIRAGLDGVEHVTSFGTALATPEEAERFRRAVGAENEARRKERYELWSRLDLDHSSRLQPLLDLMVQRKIFFSPTLAVVRDDRWGRIYEGFSEDPSIVRSYAGKMVEGLQGRAGTKAFLGAGHVIATARNRPAGPASQPRH